MSELKRHPAKLPPEQAAIRAKCFHPFGTFVEFPIEDVETSIPARFEKIVRKYPDRIAIKSGNQLLTYTELNAQANRIAHAIVDQQGDEAEPIAVLLESAMTLMAATIGVLKAGKFVALLDASFPDSRNAAILEDCQAQVVITNRKNAPLVNRITNRDCRLMDFESANSGTSDDDLRLSVSPNALAFLVYTSGSTGQPKGVMQDHRSRLHQFKWSTNTNHICEHDRASLLTSGTSSSVVVSLRTLLNGAMLLPFDIRREGVDNLAGWLLREKISVCVVSSPLFRSLCESLTGKEGFPDLRLIRLSSETAYKNDFGLYKKFFPPECLLTNGLSPTEAGALTDYFMDQETEIPGDEIPVGYPLEDIDILLLDDQGKEVGFNQVGEIAVKSHYLSSGYWRRPALTEAKFRSAPDGNDSRLYLTGDLGLMLPDGCLLHRGRKDFRVKIRGYGVEMAEVETVLRDHAAINDGVVVARPNESGEARLVAYFTSPRRPGPSVSELRRFLQDKLPDYMIPSAFVMLDAIPLTPNGKVDREALPDPQNSRPGLNAPPVAPRTSKEEKLVKIWAKELHIDQIGIHDNFFDLGGHSLLAMRVISQVRDDLQAELSLIQFFENPTVAALAARIEPARSPQHGTPAPFIQPVSRDGKLLLSFAQQRLWFIHQLEPGSCAYNLFSATQLTGRLNVMALEQSFNEIIRRHEALRTVFRSVNGQPFQVNLPTLTINLPVMELRDVVSPAERGAESRRLCTEEARRPFDLANGPLLRATLLRLTDETYVLVLVLHHIIFDGWSRGVLDQEISIAYEALSCGQSPSLPALSLQYADFAQWQRQHLRGEALEGQLAYWKKQLETLSILQLPNDRPRPAIQTSRGARQSFTLPEDLVEGLKMLGRQEGVTLFMTLLAAYQTLLGRYTGQNDIAIGAPISGRDRSEFESLIGLFLNMLVLRTDLSGNPTFRELLCRARKVCLEAYANQDVPFEELVQELQPLRSLSHNPLFQVTFALQNSPTSLLKLTGMTARDLNLGSGIATFDLHLFMVEDETTLSGWLIYNTDLFDAASIARMVRHFQMILEAVVANPDQHISDLPLLTEAEKHQLLVEWCDRREEYTKDRCLHQRFEEQVVRTPEAVAVVFEDQQLTYRELNRSANRIARRLQGLGVGPDVLVGLYVERSIELIIGVLGILKAGGAYVPFDPSYPADRVEFMLRDADVSVLLTQIHLSTQLPACDSAVVYLDTEHLRNSSDDANESDFESSAKPDDLAYVIYTSGSTGKPNGVLITHRSAGAFLNWAHSAFTQEDFAGVIASTSICFDLSVFEIFAPLTAGGQVILVENALALAHVDEAVAPTLVNTVPSVMAELLRLGGLPKSIRTVNLAGEPLKASLVRQIHQQTSAQQVYDLYGPSETTTYSTYTERTADGTQTIGRPIANTQIYILDPHGNPAPIGIPGEIYIGGAGLARGYLNRPELTAEKFIANPFSTERGARLYRTGDSARYLPDGNIEFLGRLDNQVKIRGFRIELGEIEAVLGQHSSLREAVVLVREDNPGEKQLVAYTVAAAGFMPSVNELRGFLQQKLPEYMVPSAFVMLDSLPFTPNGKVDRKALPAPDQTRPELEETFVAPRTPIEQTLVAIWGKVLKLEKVGIHDNFFELGGHSLLATQVMSRIRSAFSIDLPLRRMFESPTVAEIAFIITESQAQPVSEAAIARMLSEVEVTTEEEAQKILAK